MSEPIKPWHDCPPCPGCGLPCAVPARVDRHHSGPDDSTLKCPACGLGWVGSVADVAQAERAQAAWENHTADPTHPLANPTPVEQASAKEIKTP